MADEEGETQVEFINALDDAQIRLSCFEVAKTGATDFASNMEQAKALYNWIMGFDEADDAVELATESAPACTRKH